MATLVLGALVLLFGLWALGKISKANPKILARTVKAGGGILALGVATLLFVRGQAGLAIPLGVVGLGLLGWMPFDGLGQSNANRGQPGGREHPQGDAAAGRAAASGKMTEQEAYEILGVQPGASADEIGRAHRSLMKKLHPDQGGSTYLAARVNEAKETLLRRHR